MLHQIFTVFDSKTSAYMVPFFCPTKGAATRMFEDTCNDKESQFNRHPEDFTLFHLGIYDDEKGKLSSLPTPDPIGKAIEFINGEK